MLQKAFDRLSHIELFDILSERNMCPLIRRLLFNLYGNQQFQTRWNNCLSNMYNMTNGVKQCEQIHDQWGYQKRCRHIYLSSVRF